MSSRGAWLITAVIAMAAVYALLAGSSTPLLLGRGSAAPDFELLRLSGESLVLTELRGQVVLVNFWATWCKPCEDEMPAMERLYRALHPDGFELLAISVDEDETVVARFRDEMGISFPILLDPTRAVSSRYQAFRFPESFLIGRDGFVVERYVGPKEWGTPAYVARVRRLLAAETPGG